jgi:organic radical activating enzyme
MTTLRVIEIFDSLQGEGYWTGVPMTFVRLAGCNAAAAGLGCTAWCDTPEGWDTAAGTDMRVEEVLTLVDLPRLCLTGGEPLLQLEGVKELVGGARRLGVRVHLETNGTLDPPQVPADMSLAAAGMGWAAFFDWVCVSPKPPAYLVASGWDGLVDELKLVVDEALDAATAERLAAAHPEAVVSIQPLAAPQSLQRAIALVMAHPDWRLSLQTHKLLGLR